MIDQMDDLVFEAGRVRVVIHYGAAWVDLTNGHWRSLFHPIYVPQKEFAIGPIQVFW